jgi:hypothetical protein
MNQPHYDAPDTEGAARAAQLAAMSVTVIEALARLQAQRAAERAETDERAAAAARASRIADHAAARVTWSAALDDNWLRQATTTDLGQAWAASVSWRETDTEAADALRRVEAQLHELHPDAMAAYHQARAHGADPQDAMPSAAAHLQRPQEALSSGVRGSAPTSARFRAAVRAGTAGRRSRRLPLPDSGRRPASAWASPRHHVRPQQPVRPYTPAHRPAVRKGWHEHRTSKRSRPRSQP